MHRPPLGRSRPTEKILWLNVLSDDRARGGWPEETKCLRSVIHAGILKA